MRRLPDGWGKIKRDPRGSSRRHASKDASEPLAPDGAAPIGRSPHAGRRSAGGSADRRLPSLEHCGERRAARSDGRERDRRSRSALRDSHRRGSSPGPARGCFPRGRGVDRPHSPARSSENAVPPGAMSSARNRRVELACPGGVPDCEKTSSLDPYRSEIWPASAAAAWVCWNRWMSPAARSIRS